MGVVLIGFLRFIFSLSLFSLSLISVLSGVRALVATSLPGVVSHGRGACVATPRPFLLSLSLSLSLISVLSGVRALATTSLPGVVSHGRGACVATPRPFLLSLSLSLSLSLFLSHLCPFGGACAGNHVPAHAPPTTSLPGVVSHGRGACVATPRPFLLSLSLSLSLSFSLISVLSGVRALVTTSLPGVVSHGGGACVATPRPFLLSLSHLCPFGGACAGNHVLAWGGVPRQGCMCCHATSLLSLSSSLSLSPGFKFWIVLF